MLQIRVWGMQCIAYGEDLINFFFEKRQAEKAMPLNTKSKPAPPTSTLANSKKRGRHQQSASEPCDESNGSDGADDETLETPNRGWKFDVLASIPKILRPYTRFCP
ncbi:hypothetical protein ACEPAH_6197 [Sanghuangporus vaninii]